MDLETFLQWLIGGGGSILTVSWLFERMNWFQNLSSDAKDYTIFGAAAAIASGAYAVITYAPDNVLAVIAPYFAINAGIFASVFLAKKFHAVDKKPNVLELIGTLEETEDEPGA